MSVGGAIALLSATTTSAFMEQASNQEKMGTSAHKDYMGAYLKNEAVTLAGRVLLLAPYAALSASLKVSPYAVGVLAILNLAPSLKVFWDGKIEEAQENEKWAVLISSVTRVFNMAVAGFALSSAADLSTASLALGVVPIVTITTALITLAVYRHVTEAFDPDRL